MGSSRRRPKHRSSKSPPTTLTYHFSHMRFPSFPSLVRAFHSIANTTTAFVRSSPASTLGRTIYSSPQRALVYRSMPNIPFLGALFGSSSSMADNTNYPVQKPEGEWQAQLSPGMCLRAHLQPPAMLTSRLPRPQSNSASSAKKAPSPRARANTTSTTRMPASTPAAAAPRPSTKPTTNSIPAADGPPSGTPSPALSARNQTLVSA